MAKYQNNDRRLINWFPRSLKGEILERFATMNLQNTREFKQTINLFMKQSRFNVEAIPTMSQLYDMNQKKEESAYEFIN